MKSLVAANPRFVDRPVTCIPFGLDTEVFSPRPRDFARETLGLPRHDKIVLFIADSTENPRKGLDVLQAAVGRLIPSSGLLLASIGQGAPPPLLPNVRQHHFGATANDRWLSLIYSAADIVVVPSREEAFGQTTLEALACGTPVVGSDTGGIPDLVIPGHTGALFPVGDSVALAARLEELLARPAALERMGANGRAQVVAKNSLAACAGSHRALYESLLP
jgi:glycosyltransferase involved in cell wall biosynthesis